jgi:phytoene dehydrogenase-like protein
VGAESGELVMDQVKQIRDKKIPWNNLWGTYWCNTLFDESQAPPGKHSLNSWIYVPNSDNYDYEKFEIDKFAKETIEFWRKYAPNLTKENILAVGSQTPLDIYNRNPNMMFGDWIVGDYIPEQILMNRPIREFGKHRTTIQNLYLCGPSTNPAATIQFSNGYLAFLAIAEDYNIPQWWYDYKTKGYLYQFPYPVTVPDKTRP